MADRDFVEDFLIFIKAQEEAEQKGEQAFDCPLCGNKVMWSRVQPNNHLRCSCNGCGIRMME